MNRLPPSVLEDTLSAGIAAGLAGGVAEVAWVAFYGAVTSTAVGPVARGIVLTIVPTLAASSVAGWLGIAFHLALAIALGIGLVFALRFFAYHDSSGRSQFGLTILVLAAVWAVNFLIVLPQLNPAFVNLLPYGVTLFSKLLFGVSAATVLHLVRANRQRSFINPD